MSVFRPRSSQSVTAIWSPESKLYSARMQLAAGSVHAFAPPVGHNEEIMTVHQNVRLEMPRLGKILQSPKLERNALPIVGLRPKIRTSSFEVSHTHTWLLCLGVFVWQSDAEVADRTGVEVGSTHICDEDQERVLHSKNVFLARQH